MDDLTKIKKIIASFLETDEENIDSQTVIDRSALSSIMLHRMYALLSRELGRKISNDYKIHTLGDLLKVHILPDIAIQAQAKPHFPADREGQAATEIGVGIDIEEISNLPPAQDYRREPFYADNFSAEEISICLLQPNITQAFAARFAAKEAIIKADNAYKNTPLREIAVVTDAAGKFSFKNFFISVAFCNKLVVAVAVRPSSSEF